MLSQSIKLKLRWLAFGAVLWWVLGAGVAWAEPFEEGVAAYNRGDYVTALNTFQTLAAQGNANAQFRLGTLFATGTGVSRDDVQSVKWLRLAARQRHVEAQSNLGGMYSKGRGVIQDYVRADMWFNLAAASGDALAITNREVAERRMTPEQIALARKMARDCQQRSFLGCD
jgi:TPR repeat protein